MDSKQDEPVSQPPGPRPDGLRSSAAGGPRRQVDVAGVLALCALAALAGCHGKQAADDKADVAVTVQAAHPTRGNIVEHVNADAVLSPVAQSAIASRISAPVRRFYVQRGAHVKQGQLLATLENSDLTAAALDSKGSYTAAQATYETATRAQAPEDQQRAELDVQQTRANLALNQTLADDRRQLFAQGAIPGRDLDTAVAGLVQAQAAFDSASKHLALLESVSHRAALTAAKGQLTSAEGKYLAANAQVSYSEIRSPIAGVVTDRPLFAGETATAGAPLLTVMDTSSLLAKVHLAQPLSQRLALGGGAEIAVPGMDAPLPARISLISPALDPGSTTVEVWLRLANPNDSLKVGTPVHVRVDGHSAEHALLVPEAAILTETGGGASVVVVGPDGVAHKKPVTTGIRDSGQVQILSGLSASDTIVTVGAFTLEDGARVKVGDPNTGSDKDRDSNKPAPADDKPPAGKDAP